LIVYWFKKSLAGYVPSADKLKQWDFNDRTSLNEGALQRQNGILQRGCFAILALN
jgi:hypothetical protein